MLNITSHNGESKIKVEGSIIEITYDPVRGLIKFKSLAEQNEMCADMLLGFCKYALPKLADPEVDLDEAAKEHRKAAQEEAKKSSLKQIIKEMIKDDDGLIKTIRDILDDLEDDGK